MVVVGVFSRSKSESISEVQVPKIDSQSPSNDFQSQHFYELTVRVPFFVAIFKLFIDQLFDSPSTCGFIVVGGGVGGWRISSC